MKAIINMWGDIWKVENKLEKLFEITKEMYLIKNVLFECLSINEKFDKKEYFLKELKSKDIEYIEDYLIENNFKNDSDEFILLNMFKEQKLKFLEAKNLK